jgi:hypothetical protein
MRPTRIFGAALGGKEDESSIAKQLKEQGGFSVTPA